VFSSQKGGLFERLMGAVITEWLPAETARIDVSHGETVSINVGEYIGYAQWTSRDQWESQRNRADAELQVHREATRVCCVD